MDRYATLRDGLVWAWYPSSGATGYSLYDLTRYGRHAAFTAPSSGQWGASPRGLAVTFDGSTQYASTNITSGFSGSFSLAAWVKADSTTGVDVRNILCSDATGYVNYWIALSSWHAKWDFSIYDGSKNPHAQNSSTITVGQWYHVVGVRDQQSGKLYLYVDGKQAQTATDTTTTTPGYSVWTIGGEANKPAGRFFGGSISDCRAWSRALTPGEVLRLYVGGPGVGLLPRRHRRAKIGSQFYTRVGGVWKTATPWIKVNGVWTKATPKLNVTGTWK